MLSKILKQKLYLTETLEFMKKAGKILHKFEISKFSALYAVLYSVRNLNLPQIFGVPLGKW